MPDERRPLDLVIVTGPHRSGTTFLASVLSSAPDAVPVGVEPLNVTWGQRTSTTWYPEIETGDASARQLDRLRAGRWMWWRAPGDRPLERARAFRRSLRRNRRLRAAGERGHTVVLKDPFLSLSLDYATTLTDRPVIVAVRHPAAWVMSLARVGWHPGALLDSIPDRPRLAAIADVHELPERHWVEAPMTESAAWLWRLLVAAVVDQQQRLGEQVLLLPLERFEHDPIAAGLDLLRRAGLEPDESSRAHIEELTSGSTDVPSDTTTHVLRRDTRASLSAWRSKLASDEQRAIWEIAHPVAGQFYAP